MFSLPQELVAKIFDYDSTYHNEYKKSIDLINKVLPKFVRYNDSLQMKYTYCFCDFMNLNMPLSPSLYYKYLSKKKTLI
jgi:hypothetical protein